MDDHEKSLVLAGVEAAAAAMTPHDRDEQGLRWAAWLHSNAAKIAAETCEKICVRRAQIVD